AYQQRVAEPRRVERLPEQRAQVIEGRRPVEDERVVGGVGGADVEVGVLLERRDDHPVERKDGKGDEGQDGRPVHDGARDAARRRAREHHSTSARRDARSMTMARTSSTGTRKIATEAPRPTSPPSTPSWKARLASTWVEL